MEQEKNQEQKLEKHGTKQGIRQLLAVDLGASSGRVMLGRFDGKRLEMEELHRFPNEPVVLGNTMYWDFLRLFHEIKQGILKSRPYGKIDSISVDTWGVDFGLLDAEGRLLENPVHYRDGRTAGMLEEAFLHIDRARLYGITGIQCMEINTAYQLLSLAKNRPELLERADKLLMMPDLFHYFLCGETCWEYSAASTTQLLDARTRQWSRETMEALGIPAGLFGQITPSGTKIGTLSPEICEELGVEPMTVIASAGHDTQCALAATPSQEKDFIFVSCGTWSLFGTELDAPMITERSEQLDIANEGGVGGKISFLKNIIGTWMIQESRRQWKREGRDLGFGELEQQAKEAEAFRCLMDPDDPVFTPAGDMPGRIRAYAQKSGQPVPQTEGEIVRCIDESLALKYKAALEEIESCTGKRYRAVHILGGGVQSRLLCQMTANACGVPVIAGPVEATVLGNLAVQLMADGSILGLEEARKVVAASCEPQVYEPEDTAIWEEKYQWYQEHILKRRKEQ